MSVTNIIFRKSGVIIALLLVLVSASFKSSAQNPLSVSKERNSYEEGLRLFEQKKYAAARGAFEDFIAANGNDPKLGDALYFRAFSGLSLYHADAEDLFDDFLENYPDHPRAISGYYDIANFYYREEEFAKAAAYYEKTKAEKLPFREQSSLYFHWGYSLFNVKRFEQALSHFNKVKQTPGDFQAPALYYAGYIEYQLKQYNEALEDLRKAALSEGYDVIAHELIAATLYSKKSYRELINYSLPFLTGQKEAKNTHEIALYTAEAYYFLSEYARALTYYEQYMEALRKKPVAPVLFRIAFSYLQAGQSQNAIENFKYVALEKDTLGQAASYYLGDLYVKEGNKTFAVTAYQQASAINLNREVKEQAMFKLAQVNLDLGNYEQAIPVLNDFLEEFPSSANASEARDLLAEAYVNSTDYDRALAYFEKEGLSSQRTRRAYQKAAYLKGVQLFNNARFYESVQLFDRSLRYPLDPELEVSAWFWKGEAYSTGKKYEEAAASYAKVFQRGRRAYPELVHKANYGMGYALFNQKKYAEAAPYFRSYIENRSFGNKDALVRYADCLYAQKHYDEALSYYKRAADAGFGDKDYILYQRGVILGFQNKREEARGELEQVARQFPDSRYADDARFQAAQLDFEAGDYARAKAGFTDVINRYPTSGFIPHAYVRRASSSYNLKDYQQAANDYKRVLEQYPQHQVANNALLGLQEALGLLGKSDEVDQYIAIYRKANPGDEALESIEYERAKNLYFDQNYKQAIVAFRQYRETYPQSVNSPEALYYIGESYYRLNQTDEALEAYYLLAGDLKSVSATRVYQRVGALENSKKNYNQALSFWQKLKSVAENKRDQYTAREGLMETHYALNNADSAKYYAEMILRDDKVSFNAQNKAGLYLGKIAFDKGQYSEATDELIAVMNSAKDVNAAEAQYYIGRIQYLQKEYKRSLETLFNLNKAYAMYDYWLGRSFLLIADNYLAMNELFQAKATLESIIKNSPVEELKAEARARLQEVEKREKEVIQQIDTVQSPVKSDTLSQKSNDDE